MLKKLLLCLAIIPVSLLTGCASVPMGSSESTMVAKSFEEPADGKSGLYIYRKDSLAGSALKKDVWVDNECIGETAKGIFFYHEVEGGMEHTIATESEFSPNDLIVRTEPGKLYFFEQYIKIGLFVGGAGLKQVDNEEGRQEVIKVQLAEKGNCSVAHAVNPST